ncbi:hypothetical protein FA09DRAFT_332805 [Tilletiopsis washingtonensis]|uniref:Uncharacterized protein n=1 Tax=Tilletiopsis washingtonensis TaxID=58919 RepID=A0A316Z167_9BASI|nr:hypothetical protein FA09DRAFT_332805 [Tilletiopsis washingtonensis]PWN94688.1 hypothetical protein FA09DRAFT_332805 [Tilletiopsis washingtonensis]
MSVMSAFTRPINLFAGAALLTGAYAFAQRRSALHASSLPGGRDVRPERSGGGI